MDIELYEKYGQGMRTPEEHAIWLEAHEAFCKEHSLTDLEPAYIEQLGGKAVWTPEYEARMVEYERIQNYVPMTDRHLLENAMFDIATLKKKLT